MKFIHNKKKPYLNRRTTGIAQKGEQNWNLALSGYNGENQRLFDRNNWFDLQFLF